MDAKKTGQYLTSLRRVRGLTQQRVAEELNLSNKTISKWESGAGLPDITVLPALAELYGVTADEILAGEALSRGGAEQESAVREKEKYLLGRAKLRVQSCFIFALALAAAWCLHVQYVGDLCALLCLALTLLGFLLAFHAAEAGTAARAELSLLAARWALAVLVLWEFGGRYLLTTLRLRWFMNGEISFAQSVAIGRWSDMAWALLALLTFALLALFVRRYAGRDARLLPLWLFVLLAAAALEYGLGSCLSITQEVLENAAADAADPIISRELEEADFGAVVPALKAAMWGVGALLAAFEAALFIRVRRKRTQDAARNT